MKQYLELGDKIFYSGNTRGDRTGTGTRSLFGQQMRFDLSKGFPLVTTKPVHLKSIIKELLWFLDGSTNNNLLKEAGVNIWNDWALVDRMPLTPQQRHELLLNTKKHEGEEGYGTIVELTDGKLGINIKGSVQDLETVLDLEKIPKELIGPKDGELGPVYGKQWRSWDSVKVVPKEDLDKWIKRGFFQDVTAPSELYHNTVVVRQSVDQIKEVIKSIATAPFSRRHIVSAWNPTDMPDEKASHEENVLAERQALPPCHALFQFYVQARRISEIAETVGEEAWGQMFIDLGWMEDGVRKGIVDRPKMYEYWEAKGEPVWKLDCLLYQRSADWCLGVPFNIASYSLLTMMVAQCVGMVAGEFIHDFGDSHIYANHLETWEKEQRIRAPRELPRMRINPDVKDIFSFKYEDFTLEGYNPAQPPIKYKIAV